MEKEKADAEQAKKDKARKDQATRDMAITLKIIVDEREKERKEKVGHFTELSSSAIKAAKESDATDYKKRMQDNKARYLQHKANAPSLMERHEQVRHTLLLP